MSMGRFAMGCLGLLGLLAGLPACDSAGRERDEARRFLAVYSGLDHREPLDQREREVGELEALPLHAPKVLHARDACVSAHRALIAAERAQDTATQALDRALASKPNGEALDKQQAEGVQQSIVKAESALSGARTRFSACEAEARQLALRFSER